MDDKVTTGLDPNGLFKLLEEEIKPNVLEQAKKRLSDDDEGLREFEQILDEHWFGQSETKFKEKLRTIRARLSKDLDDEYKAFYERFAELENGFRKQDIDFMNNMK